MGKIKTINLKGNEYAQVSDRIKAFREENPNGLIETSPQLDDENRIMFTARIVKNKEKPESAEATGHALGENKGAKAFEKLETIAVGRALAMLGYMGSGEVASSEEMQEFYEYKDNQINRAVERIEQASDIDELKKIFMDLGNLIAEKRVIVAKDKRKDELRPEIVKEVLDENAKNKSE